MAILSSWRKLIEKRNFQNDFMDISQQFWSNQFFKRMIPVYGAIWNGNTTQTFYEYKNFILVNPPTDTKCLCQGRSVVYNILNVQTTGVEVKILLLNIWLISKTIILVIKLHPQPSLRHRVTDCVYQGRWCSTWYDSMFYHKTYNYRFKSSSWIFHHLGLILQWHYIL